MMMEINDNGNDDGNDDIKRKLDASIIEYNNLLLEYNQMGEDMKKTRDELNIVKHDANKKEEIINNYKQEIQYFKNELKKILQVEKELTKQNLLKIKGKRHLNYLLLYLKCILINNLYNNKQVHNILNKSILYKNDS